jgi:hypothetical protein
MLGGLTLQTAVEILSSVEGDDFVCTHRPDGQICAICEVAFFDPPAPSMVLAVEHLLTIEVSPNPQPAIDALLRPLLLEQAMMRYHVLEALGDPPGTDMTPLSDLVTALIDDRAALLHEVARLRGAA